MAAFSVSQGLLAGIKVLDLTDQRGLLAGHVLARLGADVIQVEPLGGSLARKGPPAQGAIYCDTTSFCWEAYAAGKRSVICDLDTITGRERFQQLAATTDILIESETPGVMAQRGLAWPWLRSINPKGIHVSISAFGSDGPKAGYAASDLIIWAAGGPLFANRDGDSPPLRISVPQSYRHAAIDAACGALVALFARQSSGLGQHVDISAQQSVAQATMSSILASTVNDHNFSVFELPLKPKKILDLSGSGARTRRSKWRVADGLLELHLAMGPAGWSTNNLFAWMREESALPERFAGWDWKQLPAQIEAGTIGEDELEMARDAIANFVAPMTKLELLTAGLARRITLAPVATTRDLLDSPHFAARNYFETVVSATGPVTLPARFANCDGFAPLTAAPALGEHQDGVLPALPWPTDQPSSNPVFAANRAPLAGLKVLDLSWVVAGPMIGRALADFGATVIRVESSTRLDAARIMGPFPDGQRDVQKSLLFENCNAGKFGLTLDMSRPEGRTVVQDLAGWADIVLESFAPGQMARWGLDYAELSAGHPELLMLSSSLMGHNGPYSGSAGFGNIGGAFSGFQAITGRSGERPVGPYGPYTDYIGPKFGIAVLLAALLRTRATGKGMWIDLAQVEASIMLLAPEIAECAVTGRIPEPDGNRDRHFAPHGVFRCRGNDAWVAIAVCEDTQWRRLAEIIGADLPDVQSFIAAPQFSTFSGRKAAEDALETLLSGWTRNFTATEIEHRLQRAGVPAHIVAESADFCSDPQIIARGHLQRISHGLMESVTVEGSRFRLSDTPAHIARSAPTFGRDNRHVLRSFAGYDERQIDALETADVLK